MCKMRTITNIFVDDRGFSFLTFTYQDCTFCFFGLTSISHSFHDNSVGLKKFKLTPLQINYNLHNIDEVPKIFYCNTNCNLLTLALSTLSNKAFVLSVALTEVLNSVST